MHSDVRLQVRALRVHLITAVKVALVHLSLLQALVVAVARKSAAVGRFTRRLEVAVVRRFACGKEIRLACLERTGRSSEVMPVLQAMVDRTPQTLTFSFG